MPQISEKTNPGERLPGAIGIYFISLRKIFNSKPDYFRIIPESWERGLRPIPQNRIALWESPKNL